MIQVSFSFESAREAADFLIKVGVKTEMKPDVVVSEKVETETPVKPVKAKASKKKAEPVVDIPEEDDLLGTSPAKEFTFEDIADLAKKFLKANGSEALIKVLGQFKAKKVTDVPKSEYSKLAEALA
jgi:leucyl aminopeptidase (aminopeptidase T)